VGSKLWFSVYVSTLVQKAIHIRVCGFVPCGFWGNTGSNETKTSRKLDEVKAQMHARRKTAVGHCQFYSFILFSKFILS
jgi:hypothetical protein